MNGITRILILFTNPQKLKNNDCEEKPINTSIQVNRVDRCTQIKVSTLNPDFIMEPDNSINPTPAVNSDNTVNSTTPANADNLFENEQAATEATAITATTEPPKQQRIGKQQRKSDFAEFKATYLVPSKLVKASSGKHR